jgi:hypothetical protein
MKFDRIINDETTGPASLLWCITTRELWYELMKMANIKKILKKLETWQYRFNLEMLTIAMLEGHEWP